MYTRETILVLKELRSTEDDPFPYDRVRVLGQSPVNHADITTEWVGTNGQGVIIEPLAGFAANIEKPFGELQELYDVESIPEPVEAAAPKVRVVGQNNESPGPAPEDVFAQVAQEQGEDARRVKPPQKAPDPFEQPDPEAEAAKTARREQIANGE